jgi:hypothetical protein
MWPPRRSIRILVHAVARLLQLAPLPLDLIALLRAHEPELALLLQHRGLELMPNPMRERLVATDPVDALGQPAGDVRPSVRSRHDSHATPGPEPHRRRGKASGNISERSGRREYSESQKQISAWHFWILTTGSFPPRLDRRSRS